MIAGNTHDFSLDELTAEVARVLQAQGGLGAPADRRVSAAPDARTVRYYGTLGLVDRPTFAGRSARYGRRHLLQLIAIKALQGMGLPLAEVQARLYGRSDAELQSIVDAAGAAAREHPPETARARPVCWREVTVEPGLKILAEEGWTAGEDPAALLERIRAAIHALSSSSDSKSVGGNS